MPSREEAMQVFDGLMLGDGGLWRANYFTYFHMTSSKKSIGVENHKRWLTWVRDNILVLQGLVASRGFPKVDNTGTPYLWTRGSSQLNLVWDEWYAGGDWRLRKGSHGMRLGGAYKKLPDYMRRRDYVLSEMNLAVWDMGDGGRTTGKGSHITFSTQGFMAEEVAFLAWLLEKQYGLVVVRPGYEEPVHQKNIGAGRGLDIWLATESVDRHVDIVEPYILEFCKDHEGPSFKDQKLKRLERVPRSSSLRAPRARNAARDRYETELDRLRSGLEPIELPHARVPVKPSLPELRALALRDPLFGNLRAKLRGSTQ